MPINEMRTREETHNTTVLYSTAMILTRRGSKLRLNDVHNVISQFNFETLFVIQVQVESVFWVAYFKNINGSS